MKPSKQTKGIQTTEIGEHDGKGVSAGFDRGDYFPQAKQKGKHPWSEELEKRKKNNKKS